MDLYPFVFADSFEFFGESTLSSLESLHEGVVALPHAFFQGQSQQLPPEKSLNGDCAFTESLIFIAYTAHPAKSDDAIHCPRPPLLTCVFAAGKRLGSNWRVQEALIQLFLADLLFQAQICQFLAV